MVTSLFVVLLILLAWSTIQSTSKTKDGRTEIVAWGITFFGEER